MARPGLLGQQEQQPAGHSLPLCHPLVLFQVWFGPLNKGGGFPLSRSYPEVLGLDRVIGEGKRDVHGLADQWTEY